MRSIKYNKLIWCHYNHQPGRILPNLIFIPICLLVSHRHIWRIANHGQSSLPIVLHDDESDVDVPHNHTESNVEADVHAKDQLKDELMEDIEAHRGKKAAKKEKERVSPTASNADEEEAEDAGSEEEDEGA